MAEETISEEQGGGFLESTFDGERDAVTNVLRIKKGDGADWYQLYIDEMWTIIVLLRQCASFRVYKDSGDTDLQFSMTPGKVWFGSTQLSYAGATGVTLSAAETNLVYLDTSGVLNVATVWPSTTHLRLAQIVTNATKWDWLTGLTDLRADQVFGWSGGVPAAAIADVGRLLAVTVPDATGTSPQTAQITVKDLAAAAVAESKYLVVGVYSSADGADPYATDATIAIGAAGTLISSALPSRVLFAKTDGTGALDVTVTKGTTGTVYLLVSPGPRSDAMDMRDIGTIVIT